MKARAVQLFDLDLDISSDLSMTMARQYIAGDRGVCIFDPKEFDGRM